MPITLYGVYRSRASRNIWLLKELGVKFKHVPVIQANRLANPAAKDAPLNTTSPAFRKINPNGLIPTLQDGKLILNESLAMNLYLAKKYGGKLAPRTVKEDGLMTMWTVWAVTEVEPHSINVLYNSIGKPEAERDPELLKTAIEALQQGQGVPLEHLAGDHAAIEADAKLRLALLHRQKQS